ncbi:hypothetical protein LZP81_30865 [Streptomyces parvulus]|uniref:hypothetical protein n=1 Tax=Streptomyces parvulus TaxID=146923 RepID=UPI001E6288D4|nr:hypothetical protein [Streptomyces parvulus]MCC9154892.1 hypothetical protein [Streptomyces parvulus]MCE7691263.1 hypothetical protein [Streptomyces parvulus]
MFGSKKTTEEKAAAARQRQITAAGAAAGITIMGGKVRMPGQMSIPIEGAKVTIETGETARKRITVTRIALIGIFAIWAKKDMSQLFITIEHDDGIVLVPVPARKEDKARIFATMVNGEATGISKTEAPPAAS